MIVNFNLAPDRRSFLSMLKDPHKLLIFRCILLCSFSVAADVFLSIVCATDIRVCQK